MTQQMQNATDMFTPPSDRARPDTFGDGWPGEDPCSGSGVAGVVSGYDNIRSTYDETKSVTILRLSYAVTLTVHPGTPGGALAIAGDVGIIVGAGLRARVGATVLPVGAYVALRYTGVNAEKRGMKTFDVFDVDRAYLARLHEGAKGAPVPVAPVAPAAPDATGAPGFGASGHDDLPF